MSIDIRGATHIHANTNTRPWRGRIHDVHLNRSRNTPEFTQDRHEAKNKKGHICFNPFIRVRERERQADTYNTRLVTVCNCLPPHSLSLQTQRETVRLSASPPFLPASLPTLLHPFYDGLLSKLNVLQLSFWTSVKDQNLSLLYTRKNNSIIMEDFRQVK